MDRNQSIIKRFVTNDCSPAEARIRHWAVGVFAGVIEFSEDDERHYIAVAEYWGLKHLTDHWVRPARAVAPGPRTTQVAAERERCAKIVETLQSTTKRPCGDDDVVVCPPSRKDFADAIRGTHAQP